MKHPLHGNKEYSTTTVLRDLASQENCDGEPYDQMVEAANQIGELLAVLNDALAPFNEPTRNPGGSPVGEPEWCRVARAATAEVRGVSVPSLPRKEWMPKAQRAKKLTDLNPRASGQPRCEGVYVHPHPVATTRCVSRSKYTIDERYYCTSHTWIEALRILLEE